MHQLYTTPTKAVKTGNASIGQKRPIFSATYTIRFPGMYLRIRASHCEMLNLLRTLHNLGAFGGYGRQSRNTAA